jgi:hypothetical protein
MKIGFKNTFGSQSSATSLDLQRVDLWKVNIMLPQILGYNWQDDVQFLLEKFPFPTREREMIEVKYMQQTNWQIGKDTPTPSIEIPVRYAFNTVAAEALEKWYWLVANPMTGGVGLTSQCKAMGEMTWYTPNMVKQIQDIRGNAQPGESTMDRGLTYILEGCLIKGLKFTDADQTQSNHVNILFTLQVDRYYPADVNRMVTTPVRS